MKPLQDEKPLRGSHAAPYNGYSGSIPADAFNALETEAAGLMHGIVTLAVHVKDGRLLRYTTSREQSFIPGKPTTGGVITYAVIE